MPEIGIVFTEGKGASSHDFPAACCMEIFSVYRPRFFASFSESSSFVSGDKDFCLVALAERFEVFHRGHVAAWLEAIEIPVELIEFPDFFLVVGLVAL